MAVQREVKVEPAGKSEADWSAAPRSSTDLPEFVAGEFTHLVDPDQVEPPPSPGQVEEEPALLKDDPVALLNFHMDALLLAGGKAEDRMDPPPEPARFRSIFTSLLAAAKKDR